MANVLSEEKQKQIEALGRLGWSLRRIEEATGVRRETAGAYLRAAGIAVRAPGRWGRSKPANEAITDPEAIAARGNSRARERVRAARRGHRRGARARSQRDGPLPGP